MKFGKWKWFIICILLIVFIIGYYQQQQEEKYKGLDLVPEKTADIPLYRGLKPESPVYKMNGNHWAEIMRFYEKELPKTGWRNENIQASQDHTRDGSGFISNWKKEGKSWVLSISGYILNPRTRQKWFLKSEKP